MQFQYDRPITISSAGSRKATRWPPQTLYWSELVERLKIPVRGTETLAEYLKMSKAKQDDLKDVGGYVAGTFLTERRRASEVTGRDVLTLDLDNIEDSHTQGTAARVAGLGCGYAIYSTRKHEPARPRLRVLIPLNRTCTADEYEPVSRKIADIIGMELCDPTTFEASRLMYWPSCCKDNGYYFSSEDKPLLDVDGVLAMYTNWRDVSEWAGLSLAATGVPSTLAKKQGDPTVKNGIVGAFCKTYDVYRAIDELLEGAYTPADGGRYTFAGGSTTGGAVVYDGGNFLYSHHATDPAGGKLCNAFDLVRLHKFAEKDDDAKPETPPNKLPSYIEMCRFAVADTGVATLLNTERLAGANEDFAASTDAGDNWIGKLEVSATTGTPAKTTDNVMLILENDPALKGRIAFDEFSNIGVVVGDLPWDKKTAKRRWSDVDDAGMRHYLEKGYRITGKDKIFDALSLSSAKNAYNDVQSYLKGLVWDGVKRLDALLVDYLGAEDTAYCRAVSRKSLAAAVARAMTPGCKYDYIPVFSGAQGLGKSTFLATLGKAWFSDSLNVFSGKEACELIQGTWINEIGELSGMKHAEVESVKSFASRRTDIFRVPYGKRTDDYPRRCVFFGTTNDREYLRDDTGGRRFWPVDVGIFPVKKSVFEQLPSEVDNIWAEAFLAWQLGEALYLKEDLEDYAKGLQELHREHSGREGLIREFAERKIPPDWSSRTLAQRRVFWGEDFANSTAENLVERDRICAVEVWCECFDGDKKSMKQSDTREINGILGKIEGFKRSQQVMRFKIYGPQRGYIKA